MFAAALLLTPVRSSAEQLFFRSYGAAENLTSFGGDCALQAASGFLLVCSEHGVFSYDGRRFSNLGPAQGLSDGGLVDDLAVAANGRIAIRYPDRLLVSDRPISANSPPSALRFSAVDMHGRSLYSDDTKQLAAFGSGFAIIVGQHLMQVRPALAGKAAPVSPIPYRPQEQALLDGPQAVFSADGRLWNTFADGRICSADPSAVRCFGTAQGLSRSRWRDVVAGSGGTVIARSTDRLATIDPQSGSVTEEMLPHQGEPYASSWRDLGLYRSPAGELVTQAAGGLIVRKPSGWLYLSVRDGIPSGSISSIFTDASGQIWLLVFGRGLYAGLGYGHWENLQNDDGLSDALVWQTVRAAGGSMWVATDTGIDEVRRDGGKLRVANVFPERGYALATGADGVLWGSAGSSGAFRLDTRTGDLSDVPAPAVEAVAIGAAGRVWLGTDHGLFSIDGQRGRGARAVLDQHSDQKIIAMANDRSGGLWFLAGGRLWHRHQDGRLVFVGGQWPTSEFVPYAIASKADRLWVGGPGGLYQFSVVDDRVVAMIETATADIRTNAIFAVVTDRRGFVWVGTSQGMSVFDGHRWVSVDQGSGLAGNDVAQGGITEDDDGSIWVATSQGLSHLLDPASLFADHPLRVVISQATLGTGSLPAGRLRYTTAPLSLQFGTFSYASERSIVFRYRLSGVDEGWAETDGGTARYASVPPGHHVLTVVGYDVLSHASSDPVRLTVDMEFPWWRTWWANTLYVAAAGLALYGFAKVRERASRSKQRELERLVETRTAAMRVAQAEQQRLATLDALTGLLNRAEVQRRLAERLTSKVRVSGTLVAMVDIDHFKRINDGYGHLVGDDVLQEMGVRVGLMLRPDEYAGRFGGEEILIVLDDCDGSGAERVFGFHHSIRQVSFDVSDRHVHVTCSIGLAWARPDDDWKSLIGRADEALYRAKGSGRDRVVDGEGDQSMLLPDMRVSRSPFMPSAVWREDPNSDETARQEASPL